MKRAVWLMVILVGLLSVAPHLLAVSSLGDGYKGIPFIYLDDEDYYLARIREITEGHWLATSPFFLEYKSWPAVILPLGEYFYAIPSLLMIVAPEDILILAKFLFPALLFFLVYRLARKLISEENNRELTAVLAGLMVTIGYDIAHDASTFLDILRGQATGVQLSVWTRPVNPITGGLLLFAYLNVVWEILQHRSKRFAVVGGVLIALMASYVFSWGLALAVTSVLVVLQAINKNWDAVKRLCLTAGIGLLISAPYWIALGRTLAGDNASVSARNGMLYTRLPMLNKTLLAGLSLFILISAWEYWKTKDYKKIIFSPWWLFCASLLAGGLIAFNQQLLTGRTIWPYHFVQFTKPFVYLALIAGASNLVFSKYPRLWKVGAAGAIVFILGMGTAFAGTYKSNMADFRELQKYQKVFEWLNSNAPEDCAVLVKEDGYRLGRLVPAFTHCNVYISNWIMSGVPMDRIRHNFFVYLRMQGVTPDTADEYLSDHGGLVRDNFFEDWKTLYATEKDEWLMKKTAEIIPAYADFYKRDFTAELNRYRLDYILSPVPFNAEEKNAFGVKELRLSEGKIFIYSR